MGDNDNGDAGRRGELLCLFSGLARGHEFRGAEGVERQVRIIAIVGRGCAPKLGVSAGCSGRRQDTRQDDVYDETVACRTNAGSKDEEHRGHFWPRTVAVLRP